MRSYIAVNRGSNEGQEQSTDLRYIQTLLGHGSSRTTETYTHVTSYALDKIVRPKE